MSSKVEVKCENCGEVFLRSRGEVNRNTKLNRRVFCSRSCQGSGIFDNIPKHKRISRPENLVSNNRQDEFSPFRWHYNNAKRRHKDFDLTLEDLKSQWDKQQGVCPYTGWQLKQMPNTNHKHQLPRNPDRASLDRIDSSLGYAVGNIQFISLIAQVAKSDWTEEQLLFFCQSVVERAGSAPASAVATQNR
jgi:hypothetical protein